MKTVKPTPFPVDPLVKDVQDLGAAVRAARTESGMTLEWAALSLGVAKQTLQNLEKGSGTVSVAFALRAARELGVVLFLAKAEDADYIRRKITEPG